MLLEKIDPREVDTKLDYHPTLNAKLWRDDELVGKVGDRLREIAEKFVDFLDVPYPVVDIIVTGSNCSYMYTPQSDIDVHIILDCPLDDELVANLLSAKKSLWRYEHHIKVLGYDVELYAQSKDSAITSNAGAYSLTADKWTQKPKKGAVDLNDPVIKQKTASFMDEIDELIESRMTDPHGIDALKDRIKKYRRAGITGGGEFSVENLVFKALRNNGYIEKLWTYSFQVEDEQLSLTEARSELTADDVIRICAEWFHDMGDKSFWLKRGATGSRVRSVQPSTISPRAKNTQSRKFDDDFYEHFGANFSTAASCNGDIHRNQDAGGVKIVLPVGYYGMIYSPNVDDLSTLDFRRVTFDALAYERIQTPKKLVAAMESGAEVLVKASRIIEIPINHPLLAELIARVIG